MTVNHLKRGNPQYKQMKMDDDIRCIMARCHNYEGCTPIEWPLERSAEIYPGIVLGMVEGTGLSVM